MKSVEHTRQRPLHHAALVFDSDQMFVDSVGAFVREAVAAGEPIVLSLTEPNLALLAGHCDLRDDLVFVDGTDYDNPVKTIRSWLTRFKTCTDDGATGVRAVGEVPHDGIGGDWYRWSRYEAIINRAYADVPLRGLCVYDARVTPPEVLADVARTHPFLTTDGSTQPNPNYEDEVSFLQRLPRRPGLADERPPDRTFTDPLPHEARAQLEDLVDGLGLDPVVVDDVHVAISELVSNAHHHGDDPVTVRVWAEADRLEITVTDPGAGPGDPCAGWIPPSDAAATGGGRGLWLTRQLVPTLDLWSDPGEGFTARLSIIA